MRGGEAAWIFRMTATARSTFWHAGRRSRLDIPYDGDRQVDVLARGAAKPPGYSVGSLGMDRKLARRNIIAGLVVGGIAIVMFGLTFLAASLYLS
jgi:hypothetical protein